VLLPELHPAELADILEELDDEEAAEATQEMRDRRPDLKPPLSLRRGPLWLVVRGG
jgi:hypothetical protein